MVKNINLCKPNSCNEKDSCFRSSCWLILFQFTRSSLLLPPQEISDIEYNSFKNCVFTRIILSAIIIIKIWVYVHIHLQCISIYPVPFTQSLFGTSPFQLSTFPPPPFLIQNSTGLRRDFNTGCTGCTRYYLSM